MNKPAIMPSAETGLSLDVDCRFCGAKIRHSFVDLGLSPLCETFIEASRLNHPEPFYPLHALICEQCLLVQLDEYVTPDEIYTEYAYFSSYSDSWLEHAKKYTESVSARFDIGADQMVMEIASNDGYLLRNFVAAGVPVLGIEPAANVAAVAIEKGIPTEVRFFGVETAKDIRGQYGQPDLLLGNNVLAHVPDLNDFVAGMKILLKDNGVITMEFPHLMRLMEENQYDTIYHEHFSYFSLTTVEKVFAAHGLTLFDVEELPTHGGSIRVFVRHAEDAGKPVTDNVARLKSVEQQRGLLELDTYAGFAEQVRETKRDLLAFLIDAKRSGKSIAGYGAPGKGNTLLNYCGIREDFLDYTVDRSTYKHGKYTPGTRIPIFPPEKIRETRPDYLLVLPWNLLDEIVQQTAYIREWGGRWVAPIPRVSVID